MNEVERVPVGKQHPPLLLVAKQVFGNRSQNPPQQISWQLALKTHFVIATISSIWNITLTEVEISSELSDALCLYLDWKQHTYGENRVLLCPLGWGEYAAPSLQVLGFHCLVGGRSQSLSGRWWDEAGGYPQCFQCLTPSHDMNYCDVCLLARPTFQKCRAIRLYLWNLDASGAGSQPVANPDTEITKLTFHLGSPGKAQLPIRLLPTWSTKLQSLCLILPSLTLSLFLLLGKTPVWIVLLPGDGVWAGSSSRPLSDSGDLPSVLSALGHQAFESPPPPPQLRKS